MHADQLQSPLGLLIHVGLPPRTQPVWIRVDLGFDHPIRVILKRARLCRCKHFGDAQESLFLILLYLAMVKHRLGPLFLYLQPSMLTQDERKIPLGELIFCVGAGRHPSIA